jgi:lipopolysaccharide/colanic/teichoic acid biosynthesis glycosyltransferase
MSGALRTPTFGRRLLDLVGGIVGTIAGAPVILCCALVIWLQDRRNPFYASERVGLGGRPFRCIKIRTMIPDASASRVDTTVVDDPRLLPAGRLIRAMKADELPQFWHVLTGRMSLVGPRPNVPREVRLYTVRERELLAVRPGITDYASIVFADLGTLLAGQADANIAYNQLVRPWKSSLGLHYLATQSVGTDLRILGYTLSNVFARGWTLRRIAAELARTGAPLELQRVAARSQPLAPTPPPGATAIVVSRGE